MKLRTGRTTRAAALFALLSVFAHASSATLQAAQSARAAGSSKKESKTKSAADAQQAQTPLLKRTAMRRETLRFPFGGRVSINGAPQGSIAIEGWQRNEVEIVADIELNAATEEDLARLVAVNGFSIDDEPNHIRILTTGTHDRKFMKRAARDFPKKLLNLPWRIDYRIRVPLAADLEIYAGHGPVAIKDVEGAISLNAGESSPAALTFAGGDVVALLQGGTVNLEVPTRSWRGQGLNLRLLRGDVNVKLPAGFNGYVNAEILRAGRIENSHAELEPLERTRQTARSLQGRAGAGGATLSFTVGDGTIRISQ